VSDEALTFRASFPSIQSAIKVHGNGDGMRVQFDIPESDMPDAIGLMALRQQVLEVTVKVVDEVERDTNDRKPYF
jgi:hypothetical protein